MIDILISGINGKMGRAVYAAAERVKGVNIVCGVDKLTVGNFACPVYTDVKDVCEHVDAIIDFSSPSALGGILEFALDSGCAVVLATTGYSKKQMNEIEEASKFVPICVKPNMSLGIQAILKVLPELKKLLPEFDITIAETHRKGKKDKPSGTAIALSKAVSNEAECEIVSVRGGDVPGIHEINFLGENEVISIKHTAFSREVFARGALKTCVNLYGRPPKLYEL